jgi:hypothetical protein
MKTYLCENGGKITCSNKTRAIELAQLYKMGKITGTTTNKTLTKTRKERINEYIDGIFASNLLDNAIKQLDSFKWLENYTNWAY